MQFGAVLERCCWTLFGIEEIIDFFCVLQLNRSLPSRTVGHCWVLVYSTFQHGFSLKTLYRKMEYYDSPILLVVNDGEHQVSTKRFMWSSHNAPREGTFRDDLLELRYGTDNA